jgi:ribosomal protein L36
MNNFSVQHMVSTSYQKINPSRKKYGRKEKVGKRRDKLSILNRPKPCPYRGRQSSGLRRRAISITPVEAVMQTQGTFKGLDSETIKWLAEDEELSGY